MNIQLSLIKKMNKLLKLYIILIFIVFPQFFLIIKKDLHSQDKKKNFESQTNLNLLEQENFLKGEDHFYKKRFYTAEIFFQKVIEINPENAYAHSYLGDIYLNKNELDKAIHHFKIASELLSDLKLYNNKNNNDILFLKSINPKDVDIPLKEYFRLAQAYYLKKQPEQSEYYCKIIINKFKDFFQCYYYLGMIELEFRKNRQQTIEYLEKYKSGLEKFLQENPQNAISQEKEKVENVLKLLAQNEDSSLKNDLKKELDPLNLFYKPPKKEETSINEIKNQSLNLILPTEKKFDPMWVDIQYYKKQDRKKALELLKEYETSNEPKTSKDYYFIKKFLCNIYFEVKDFSQSEKECLKALQYDFEPEILFYLGLIAIKQNKKDEFYQYIKKYLEYKQDIQAYYLMGYELYHDKKYDEALNYFEKLTQSQPNHKEGLYYQFLIYKELNQLEFMKQLAQKIFLYYPKDLEILRSIVFDLLEKDEKNLSSNLLNHIYKNSQSLDDGLILAGFYVQEDKNNQALEILSELYQNYPTDYRLIRILILLLKQMNRNYDTIERITQRFLDASQNPTEKEEILKILPEEIRLKMLEKNQK
jgi:tetratricopeptide (TPR) repeat protein